MTAVAERAGFTSGELALAWAARHPAVSLVFIGGRSVAQIAQGAAALAKMPPPPSTGSTTTARDSPAGPASRPIRPSQCFCVA